MIVETNGVDAAVPGLGAGLRPVVTDETLPRRNRAAAIVISSRADLFAVQAKPVVRIALGLSDDGIVLSGVKSGLDVLLPASVR